MDISCDSIPSIILLLSTVLTWGDNIISLLNSKTQFPLSLKSLVTIPFEMGLIPIVVFVGNLLLTTFPLLLVSTSFVMIGLIVSVISIMGFLKTFVSEIVFERSRAFLQCAVHKLIASKRLLARVTVPE